MTRSSRPFWMPACPWVPAFLLVFSVIGISYAAGGAILYNRFGDTVTLRQVNPDGSGDTQVIVDLPSPQCPTWSRDGRLVSLASPLAPDGSVYPNTFNAFVFDPATGTVRQITTWPDTFTGTPENYTEDFTWVFSKAFESDSRRLAVVSMRYVVHWLYRNGQYYNEFLEFFPIFEVYDAENLSAKVVVGEGLNSGALHQGDGLDWVPDKELLICPWVVTPGSGPATALVAVAPVKGALDAGRFRKLTAPQFFKYSGKYGVGVCYDQDFQPAVGPVSNRVVYVRERDCIDGGNPLPSSLSVRMVNLDGTGDRAIYSVPAGQYISHLSWAPDESKLVISRGTQEVTNGWPMPYVGAPNIYLLNANGTGLRQIAGPGDYPAWNPLGPTILRFPSISDINPATVGAGDKAFSLTITGKNFHGSEGAGGLGRVSKVLWNGSALPTRYVSPATLVAAVPAAAIKAPGNVKISVSNPPPGGGASGTATLTIGNPTPAVSSLSPASAGEGAAAFTLTITGSGFCTSSVAKWNGTALVTKFASATKLQASVPAADLTKPGAASITAFNPAPAGGASKPLTFTVSSQREGH